MQRNKTTRAIACALMAGALATTSTALTNAAPEADQPAPPGSVAELIQQIQDVDNRLAALTNEVAAKREAVNKALVDLQDARQLVGKADFDLSSATDGLAKASERITEAQAKFNKYAASAYTKGNPGATLTAYLSGSDAGELLDRAQFGQLIAAQQRDVITKLTDARAEESAKVDAAQTAKAEADAAVVAAESRKNDAEQAISVAETAANEQNSLRTQLMGKKDLAIQLINSLRAKVGADDPDIQAYDAAETSKANQLSALKKAVDSILAVGFAGVSRVSEDESTKSRAAELARRHISHTEVTAEGLPVSAESATTPESSSAAPNVRGSQAVEIVVNRAISQVGVPYAWGGGNANGPTKGIRDGGVADSFGDFNKVGFDCSGLMIYAFAGIGIDLPHYSGYQYQEGIQVPVKSAQRGDMLFWGGGGSQHVALYLGDGMMIEAPQSGSYVQITDVRWSGIQPYAVRLTD